MKLIIAGGRDFNNYSLLKKTIDKYILGADKVEIITGGAMGADALGVNYSISMGIPIRVIKADWVKYGKSAGPIRNAEMATNATDCICFWDGVSRGTASMINEAKKANLKLTIIHY